MAIDCIVDKRKKIAWEKLNEIEMKLVSFCRLESSFVRLDIMNQLTFAFVLN